MVFFQKNDAEKLKTKTKSSANDNFCGFQKGFLSSTKKNTNKKKLNPKTSSG